MIRFLFIYVQIEQENRAGKALFNFFCIEMRSLFWNFLRWDLHHFLRWDLHFGIFTKIYLLERQIYIEGASETRNRDRKEEGGEERERENVSSFTGSSNDPQNRAGSAETRSLGLHHGCPMGCRDPNTLVYLSWVLSQVQEQGSGLEVEQLPLIRTTWDAESQVVA